MIDARAGFAARYTKDAIIPTMSHELTHWMKQKSPELYAELSRKIFSVLTEATGKSEYDLITKELASHPELTDDGARDEMIARACEDLFSMSETGREIFNSLSAEEQNTLKAKIKEIVNNILDWVNKLLGMYESNSPEANTLRKYEAELQDILKTWDQMLAKSVEVNAALETEGITGEALAKEITDAQLSEKETITQAEIDALRSIGRKSINEFTSEDIKKAEPFARRMWKELGVKSTFFRNLSQNFRVLFETS